MSLGTCALSVGRGGGGWALQAKARRYSWQPREQEPTLPAATKWHCHTEPDQWKNTRLTSHTYHKVGNSWKGGVGTQVPAPLQIDLWRSIWIHKNSLKQMLNDPLWSARIYKDSQQEQQLIHKGSYKPWLMIRNDQNNQTIRKHTSKEPCQRRGGAKPLWPPRIIAHALWGYLLTPQNTTCN